MPNLVGRAKWLTASMTSRLLERRRDASRARRGGQHRRELARRDVDLQDHVSVGTSVGVWVVQVQGVRTPPEPRPPPTCRIGGGDDSSEGVEFADEPHEVACGQLGLALPEASVDHGPTEDCRFPEGEGATRTARIQRPDLGLLTSMHHEHEVGLGHQVSRDPTWPRCANRRRKCHRTQRLRFLAPRGARRAMEPSGTEHQVWGEVVPLGACAQRRGGHGAEARTRAAHHQDVRPGEPVGAGGSGMARVRTDPGTGPQGIAHDGTRWTLFTGTQSRWSAGGA